MTVVYFAAPLAAVILALEAVRAEQPKGTGKAVATVPGQRLNQAPVGRAYPDWGTAGSGALSGTVSSCFGSRPSQANSAAKRRSVAGRCQRFVSQK